MSFGEVHSVSICAQLGLDMHALNNEGGEGNQIQTRMVHVVDAEGKMAVVNAVSGDMLKHIQAEHLWRLATECKLRLCEGCRRFNPNRINMDRDFLTELGDSKDNTDILTRLLRRCTLDDAEGVLMTEGKRSMSRKSVVEFGWLIGLPAHTRTETYFHVKFDAESRQKGSSDGSGANLGQAIFHRPANSGLYAFLTHIELARLGFNDISREYVLSAEERLARSKAVLQSVALTLLAPQGAQRNTQLPHILDATGAITVSRSVVPAPIISPLGTPAGDSTNQLHYIQQLKDIAAALNRIRKDSIVVLPFSSLSEFATLMMDLSEQLTQAA